MKKLLCILLSGLFLFSNSYAATNKPLTVLLDWFVNPDHAPLFVAQQQGFYQEQGIKVKFISPADPSDAAKLVASGKADLGVTYQPQFVLQQHQGLPLVQVGTLVATPLDCLMVLKKGPIHTLKDLKGKKIGYSSSVTGLLMLKAFLNSAGLTASDVHLINVHYDLTQALLAKRVAAVTGVMRNFEPFEAKLVGKPVRLFYPEEHGMPLYSELIFVANSKERNDPRIGKFLRAVRKGVVYLLNHPEQSWDKFAANHPELNNKLNREAWFATLPRFALRPGLVASHSVTELQKYTLSNIN